MEYKYTPLTQLKMKDKGSGEILGHRAVFGNLDEGGDVLIKGAFTDCLDSFLHSGFSAHSHTWTFAEAVGFPVEAYEDSKGLFVRSQFHSTQTAQDVRTIAKERMDAGKQVGFSFGYSVVNSEHVSPGEYDSKLPLYLKSEHLADGLKKARGFSSVRILKKVEIIEDSIVTAPMNRLAAATGIKAGRSGVSQLSGARLRVASALARNAALRTIYGLKGDLREESERLRNEAEWTMLELQLAQSRLERARRGF